MSFFDEIRIAIRRLTKSPGFAVVAVLALGLGIGVNSTVFSLISGILLRPLPYRQPETLVAVWDQFPALGWPRFELAEPEVIDLREQSRSFVGVAAYLSPTERNMTGAGEPVRLTGARVTPDLFQLLGISASLGRVFTPEDGRPGAASDIVVLSQAFFQERFGGNPAVLGTTLHLDDHPYKILGVLPNQVRFPTAGTQFYLPLIIDKADLGDRGNHELKVIGRLKPGVSVEHARAEMDSLAQRLQQDYPAYYPPNSGWSIGLVSLHEEVAGGARPALLLLAAAAALILLLTCANLAHLLLLRAESRQSEIGVRVAFGAGARQVKTPFFAESLLLALAGGALALLSIPVALQVFRFWNPENLPNLDQVTVDWRVLAFTAAIVLLTALLFGTAPGRITRLDLRYVLSAGIGRTTTDPRQRKLRSLLVILEVAVSFLLLAGAALLLRSFWKVQDVPPGFDPSGVLTLQVSLSRGRYSQGEQVSLLYRQLQNKLAVLPGVVSVGAVTGLPMADENFDWSFQIEGRPVPPGQPGPTGDYQVVLPGYFETLRIPVVRGHGLTVRDDARTTPVLVINETMAQRYWPDENPMGKRIRLNGTSAWVTIVGVVRDVRHRGLEAETRAENTFALDQFPAIGDTVLRNLTIVIRTTSDQDPLSLAKSARRAIWSVDPNIPISRIVSLDSVVAASTSGRRFSLWLFAAFAVLALALAALGTYGVISYTIAQRTREIGIRMALGTSRGRLLGMILWQGLTPVLAGIAVGLALSLAFGRLVSSLLYEVPATDLASFLGVFLILLAVALLAVAIPARRATRLDPVFALHHE